MRGEVAIVGTHEEPPQPEQPDVTEAELVYRAARGALESAGMDREELDTVVVAGNDVLAGRTISNVFTAEAEGGFMKDETKVALDGLHAANYTAMRILAQTHETAIVVGYGKPHGISFHEFTNLALDPLRVRPVGVDGVHLAALQARRYYEATEAGPGDGARVAAKNLGNAEDNPNTHWGEDVSPASIEDAPVASSPLREPEVGPAGDGGAALVMTTAERAESYSSNPASILGMGHASDSFRPGRDAFWRLRAASRAGQEAFQRAGADPADVDVAEVSEFTAPQELMLTEALGLAKRGRGAQLLRDGTTARDGELPVNPSGGALGGHCYFGTGILRLAQAAKQVTGEAGPTQVEDARVGLAHGATGAAHQANAAMLLGGPEEVGA